MKKAFKIFKELWKHPRYKSLIKLSGYFIFFTIFFAIASLGSTEEPAIKETTITPFNSLKTNLNESNLKVNYHIFTGDDYYFEGTIINNIFNGTLEYNEELKRIKIEDNTIFEIQRNEEIENYSLQENINIDYLIPSNIINLIDEKNPIIKNIEEEKTYSYSIDNTSLTLFTNEEEIFKIVILDMGVTYELKYENMSNK